MAYQKKHGLFRSDTFKDDILHRPDQGDTATSSSDRRLEAFRSSSGAFHSFFNNRSKASTTYDFTSMRSTNEPRGFWGVLARKAKAILEDEVLLQSNSPITIVKAEKNNFSTTNQVTGNQAQNLYELLHQSKKLDTTTLRAGLNRITSLNQIGDTLENAMQDKKAQDRTQETSEQPQTKQETQLQASRDVAIAIASKVKQLVRELKNVKAELAFAKELCSELEEENKTLRQVDKDGDHLADDMIRVQLEMLLEEKGRLANENTVYARENRCLRGIVEFHQLTMQDMMYLEEEEDEEIKEVNLLKRTLSCPTVLPAT